MFREIKYLSKVGFGALLMLPVGIRHLAISLYWDRIGWLVKGYVKQVL